MKFLDFEHFCRQNQLTIFTISDLKVILTQYSVEYLRLKLARWKQKGYLRSPKRGLYILRGARPDEFEIASKLITPSYISLETALSHYSLIPEISAEVASVTTKNTCRFQAGQTRYRFHHVKQTLFFDFLHLKDEIFIATPEKAILDFLYLKKPDGRHPFFERINREKTKGLNLKAMTKAAGSFPADCRRRFNYFKHVITK